MNVQFLIGCYAVICLSMIAYNCFCILFFRGRDDYVARHSRQCSALLSDPDSLDNPKKYRRLKRHLRRVDDLLAFSDALETLKKEQPERYAACQDQAARLLCSLVPVYSRRAAMQQACFAHTLAQFGVAKRHLTEEMTRFLLEMLHDSSVYCRENAMRALYASGRTDLVMRGLRRVDESGDFFNARLITEGLLSFDGDRESLISVLWAELPALRTEMQVAVLNFIRFGSGQWADAMLALLKETTDVEIAIACLRYFGRFPDHRALPLVEQQAQQTEQWEIAAVAMAVLASYPGENTVQLLKQGLSSRNWYVRYNAAASLCRLNVTYEQVRDMLEGQDPYARQMLLFQLERTWQEEEKPAGKRPAGVT